MSNKYRSYAEQYVKKCDESELLKLVQIFREARDRWNSVQPGWLYLVEGGYGDLFKHEILEVDREHRKLLVKDHSMPEKPTKVIDYLPRDLFKDEEEMQEYINNLPPSFF